MRHRFAMNPMLHRTILRKSNFRIRTFTIGLPDGRYCTANLAEAGKKPVNLKPVPEAGILKTNNLQ